MKETLEKLFSGSREDACEKILQTYSSQGRTVVNFLYFSIVTAQKLFEENSKKTANQKEYKKAIMNADFLLPDWIALQVYYFFAVLFTRIKSATHMLANLNWTDFVPYFIKNITKKYGTQKLCILLYGSYPEYVERTKQFFSFKWYNVIYTQDGYTEFEWEKAKKALSVYHDTINILLVARSTPKLPIQELWTAKNMGSIKDNNLLVMNVWGLFDFLIGVQTRAPKLIRAIKCEWLWRLLTQPKRNAMKVYYTLFCVKYFFTHLLLKKK